MTPIIMEEDEDEEGGWIVADEQLTEDAVIDLILASQEIPDEE